MTLGEFLKEKRKAKGFTQEKLSEIAAISVAAISLIETDKIKPQSATLGKLCKVLECFDEIEKYL